MRHLNLLLLCVLLAFVNFSQAQVQTEIACKEVNSPPWKIFPMTYHEGQSIQIAVNPAFGNLDGIEADIYVVEDKTSEEWLFDPTLVDVRSSGVQSAAFSGEDLQTLWVELENVNEISGSSGARPGVAYDVIIDLNQNGTLDAEDYIDGYEGPGMVVVSDMNEAGPNQVDSLEYISPWGEWQTFRVYYPTTISEMEAQPLVVISHGWTHEYTYYSHLGNHLASYGYIVMSHKNDVGNGGALATTTASESALQNIDTLLTIYPELEGGILAGKIDKNRIVHSGHSTGGECVVRAYNRLYTGDYVSPHITHENIVCTNAIAPVSFLSAEEVHPQGSNHHQFLAAADTDVSGAAVDAYVQAFSIYERGYGNKHVTYIHGAGHGDLHNADAWPWANGPDLIGKEATHSVMRPYMLALCELYTRDNVGMKDFFTRNMNEFRPTNIDENIKISGEYKDAMSAENTVIDDFETNNMVGLASTGGAVNSTLADHFEVLMRDHDGSFNWYGNQWSNGMCRSRYDDDPHCAVFGWQEEGEIEYVIPSALNDWSISDYLSFRACQISRHPNNIPLNEDLTFSVRLTDGAGSSSTLNIGAYGGISKPYPKNLSTGGDDGVYDLCLLEGTYTIELGGSNWEEEMSFNIPRILNGEAGTYEFEIGAGDPCTDIQIFLFDSYGDGWDAGTLVLTDTEGNELLNATLEDGFGPDVGEGWQNEFYTIRMRLTDFLSNGSGVDLSNIASLIFHFGPSYGSVSGAIGLDDIELVRDGLTHTTEVSELVEVKQPELRIYPNPMYSETNVIFEAGRNENWSLEVVDYQGRLVRTVQNISGSLYVLNKERLNSGMYVLVVRSANARSQAKLIVK